MSHLKIFHIIWGKICAFCSELDTFVIFRSSLLLFLSLCLYLRKPYLYHCFYYFAYLVLHNVYISGNLIFIIACTYFAYQIFHNFASLYIMNAVNFDHPTLHVAENGIPLVLLSVICVSVLLFLILSLFIIFGALGKFD